ncbi:MAG TPA: hypothetical protein VG894_03485 [Bauldia sp.]|nr:hypothetical protein [Bauldia sp.]
MPFETTLVVIGVVAVFTIFALVLAYVNHIASGPNAEAADDVVAGHASAHAVRRADTLPDLIRRKEGHDDLTESHSTIH